MNAEDTGCDAGQIEVVGWPEAVRKRPGMFIGSTDERGLRYMVLETAERAMNGILAGGSGGAGRVDVTLRSDGGVRVADDGPGVSVEVVGRSGLSGLGLLLTHLPSGVVSLGRNELCAGMFGVGLAVVNALSSRLTVEVRRDGVRWVQEYARGTAVMPLTEAGPAADCGTTMTFWPDASIFSATECAFEPLAERLRELAFLNRALDVSLTDQRFPGAARESLFRFPGGARDFVAFLDGEEAVLDGDIVGFEHEDSAMAGTLEVALRWRGSGEPRIRSFANSRATHDGTHERGFRAGVTAAIDAYAREHGLLAEMAPELSEKSIGQGLTAVVSVKLDHPEFEGSTRGVLGNRAVRACVRRAVREYVGRWLDGHPEQAAVIVGRIVQAARGE